MATAAPARATLIDFLHDATQRTGPFLVHDDVEDESDLRRVDPRTGEVVERLEMPAGVIVSGLESDGGDQFFCGGGSSGTVRAVRRRAQTPNGRSKAGGVPPSTR